MGVDVKVNPVDIAGDDELAGVQPGNAFLYCHAAKCLREAFRTRFGTGKLRAWQTDILGLGRADHQHRQAVSGIRPYAFNQCAHLIGNPHRI